MQGLPIRLTQDWHTSFHIRYQVDRFKPGHLIWIQRTDSLLLKSIMWFVLKGILWFVLFSVFMYPWDVNVCTVYCELPINKEFRGTLVYVTINQSVIWKLLTMPAFIPHHNCLWTKEAIHRQAQCGSSLALSDHVQLAHFCAWGYLWTRQGIF